MAVLSSREIWLRVLGVHSRSAGAHESTSERFASLGDQASVALSAREFELAASERRAYAEVLARHPEWAEGLSAALHDRP